MKATLKERIRPNTGSKNQCMLVSNYSCVAHFIVISLNVLRCWFIMGIFLEKGQRSIRNSNQLVKLLDVMRKSLKYSQCVITTRGLTFCQLL